ncbi:hypothetical protein LSCM4_07906 [Leishmania orientalis]|uniref:Anoctamin transmembrane domain-containing protein n=1 Tax=Leishmania orientalis TaxID=2249476 RepID=A0A836KVH2_9TRYP|nr:hypothetical protein LSCM4_07906 [Leishmania orientalis]
MTTVPAKSLASKPTAAAAAAPPASAPAVISAYVTAPVSGAGGVRGRRAVGATAHVDPPKRCRRSLGKPLLGMLTSSLSWSGASDKKRGTGRSQRQRAPPVMQTLPSDTPRSITPKTPDTYATQPPSRAYPSNNNDSSGDGDSKANRPHSESVAMPCSPVDMRGGRLHLPHKDAPLRLDAGGKPSETPRGVTEEQLAAAAVDAQQQLGQPSYVALKARQVAAEQRWKQSHNYDRTVQDLHERLGVVTSAQRGAGEEENPLSKPMEMVADVTGKAIALRRAEMAEMVARLRRMVSEADITGIPIIPAASLDASSIPCPSCQYCIELASEATIKEYLIAVLRVIASERVYVPTPAKHESESVMSGAHLKSWTAREPLRAHKDHAHKRSTAAAAPRLSAVRCFRVEVVPFALHKVSIHVSVYKSVAEHFYTAHALQQERLFSLAVDPPFPKEWAEWTDAHRQRLLHGILGELLYGGVAPAVPATLETITLFPAHVESIRDTLWRSVWPARSLTEWLTIPEDAVASYLGEEVMFYFAWMNHYARWLLAAGLLGVVVSLLSSLRLAPDATVAAVLGKAARLTNGTPVPAAASSFSMTLRGTAQHCMDVALLPLFSASIIIGSVLCIKLWERRCSALCMKYHLFQQEGKDELRHDFRGTPGTNPITGVSQLCYPAWYRAAALQPLAWGVVALFMASTLALMVCSLNLDGMVTDPESRLAIPFLRRLAVDGGVLDKTVHPIAAMFPPLGYSACIAALSCIFTGLAKHLTRMENYRYRGQYVRALTLKRVAFEFVNSYAKLLFIAFGRGSVSELSSHLQAILCVAVLRRMASDTLLPFVRTHRQRVVRHLFRISGGGASSRSPHAPLSATASLPLRTHGGSRDSPLDEVDEMLDLHDIYMDFIDMLIQFGHILFFAAAYPLAPFVALLSNIVAVRSHLFKMCYVVRRPVPRLGMQQNAIWCGIMRGFVVVAVMTNTFLLAFTSHQAVRWFPDLFTATGMLSRQRTGCSSGLRSGGGSVAPGAAVNLNISVNLAEAGLEVMPGKGRVVVLYIMVVEHVMCLIAVFLLWRIPSTPREVRQYKTRKLHERMSLR